ncbi:hypothetical protein [Streptomyces chryseus]|uniref:Integral membrane protein n=1 Tax=Streptomyces chryseus TaxID=68186 RepID=A0ABQ3DCW7_9ACTN|nr:hypothetical protein [Streptomyces chryseus]GHA83136.1 hypothetical protein GCM10010346_01830 [Streptomyces chryseus]
MHQRPAHHTAPAPTYADPAASAPLVYQPQPYGAEHQALVLPAPAADPRRALVRLESGEWVTALVPAAPPVLVPAAPVAAAARRPLSGLERGAIIVVTSICALSLSIGGALSMAGPASLAAAADLAVGAAVLLGTAVAGFLGLRFAGALSRPTSGTASSSAPAAPTYTTNVTNNVSSTGWFSRATQTTTFHQG